MAMKVDRIEVFPVRIPMRGRLEMAVATVEERSSLIVRVTTDDGVVGLGEAVLALYFSGETPASAAHLVREVLAPLLVGRHAGDLVAARRSMRAAAVHNNAARAAVEMALHDVVAKAAGIPLFELYGGRARSGVPTIWHVSGGDPAANAEEAARAVREDGFPIVKVKVGGEVDRDVARVLAVRSAVGPEVLLLPDANQGWDAAAALRFSHGVAEAAPGFLEQPVPRHDLLGMARVNAGPVPVAADEGVSEAHDLHTHLHLGAVGAAVVKLMKSAGPIGAREVFAVADAAGIGVHLAAMPGQTSIGAAHAAHLGLAVPNLVYGSGICPYYLTSDVVTHPLRPVHGLLHPPERPGLGMELDEEAVGRFRLDV